MNRLSERVVVEPLSEPRLEQLESRLVHACGELPARSGRRSLQWLPAAAVAVAAVAVVSWLVVHRPGAVPHADTSGAEAPARVVTGAGESTRVELGDAVVLISEQTAVELYRDELVGIELRLHRGRVDCEVEPIAGRAPFAVVAGDVRAAVVGTRFSVERAADGVVRVAVARGRVHVTAADSDLSVSAGEQWSRDAVAVAALPRWARPPSEAAVASAEPDSVAEAPAEPEVPKRPSRRARNVRQPEPEPESLPAPTRSRVGMENPLFEAAARAEQAGKLGLAVNEYARALGAARPGSASAQYAMYSMAELELRRGQRYWRNAQRRAKSYEHAYPQGVYAKDALWLRIYVLHEQGNRTQARDLARDYLDRFGHAKYGRFAEQLVQGE